VRVSERIPFSIYFYFIRCIILQQTNDNEGDRERERERERRMLSPSIHTTHRETKEKIEIILFCYNIVYHDDVGNICEGREGERRKRGPCLSLSFFSLCNFAHTESGRRSATTDFGSPLDPRKDMSVFILIVYT